MSDEPLPDAPLHDGARRTALWLLLSVAGAIGVAWVAIQLQNQGFAPIGLTAVAIGVAVAEISGRSAKSTGAGGRRARLAVALAVALLVVIAQDYIGFWEHVRQRNRFESTNPKAAAFAAEDESLGPAAFVDFWKSRLGRAPGLWGLDAALTLGSAMAWTLAAVRRPE